ncbi:MAG: hypothetical protein NVSMB14_16010 [Isosphaeraceae bacterium]
MNLESGTAGQGVDKSPNFFVSTDPPNIASTIRRIASPPKFPPSHPFETETVASLWLTGLKFAQ